MRLRPAPPAAPPAGSGTGRKPPPGSAKRDWGGGQRRRIRAMPACHGLAPSVTSPAHSAARMGPAPSPPAGEARPAPGRRPPPHGGLRRWRGRPRSPPPACSSPYSITLLSVYSSIVISPLQLAARLVQLLRVDGDLGEIHARYTREIDATEESSGGDLELQEPASARRLGHISPISRAASRLSLALNRRKRSWPTPSARCHSWRGT